MIDASCARCGSAAWPIDCIAWEGTEENPLPNRAHIERGELDLGHMPDA